MTSSVVSDLRELPLVLTLKEVAAVYRISVRTLRDAVQLGTFSPPPWATYPYRWRRQDVAADLERSRGERPHKAHGFAATKARKAAKAPLSGRDSQPQKAS